MFLEHSLRSSKKNVKLAPNSRFFPELELLEQDAFGTTRWWSCYSFWSGALTNTPLVSIFAVGCFDFGTVTARQFILFLPLENQNQISSSWPMNKRVHPVVLAASTSSQTQIYRKAAIFLTLHAINYLIHQTPYKAEREAGQKALNC